MIPKLKAGVVLSKSNRGELVVVDKIGAYLVKLFFPRYRGVIARYVES